MAELQTYRGGCQCGAVRYEVSATLDRVLECNCSRCARLGSKLTFVPATQFELLSGEERLTEYRFNQKRIQHLFCATCGVQSFARGAMPDGTPMVSINVRCLDGVDLDALPVRKFDGRSL